MQIIQAIVNTIGHMGYFGIFVMMGLESSFFPFPSEVVIIPAGYLASQNQMNLLLSITIGIAGSIMGSLLNYYLAYKFGRGFLLRYGKFVFFTPKSLEKMEGFFAKHGEISTFVGRLIPGVRQYISLPAGLAKMNLFKFCFFTGLGAGVWVGILTLFGYYLGVFLQDYTLEEILSVFSANDLSPRQLFVRQKLHTITLVTLASLACGILLYVLYHTRRKK